MAQLKRPGDIRLGAATGPGNRPVSSISFDQVMSEARAFAREQSGGYDQMEARYNPQTKQIEFWNRARSKYGPDASTEWKKQTSLGAIQKFNDLLKMARGKPTTSQFERTSAGELVYKPARRYFTEDPSSYTKDLDMPRVLSDEEWNRVFGQDGKGSSPPYSPPSNGRNLEYIESNGQKYYKQTSGGRAGQYVNPLTTNTYEEESQQAEIDRLKKLPAQKLFMEIHKGNLTPSKDDPVWTALYKDGKPTAFQKEAFSKWENYMKDYPEYVRPEKKAIQMPAPKTESRIVAEPEPEPDVTEPAAPVPPEIKNIGYEEALKQLLADPRFQALPDDWKSAQIEALKNVYGDPTYDDILTEFENIKNNSIDPRFSKEVESMTNQFTREYSELQAQRAAELEVERAGAGADIRQARGALEATGMTFTGRGIEQLGAQSAFAREGGQIPSQTPVGPGEDLTTKEGMTFQDGRFFEGSVNQANRLMSSSSALRYQQNLAALGQRAENILGGAANVIPGYAPSGQLPGSAKDARDDLYRRKIDEIAQQQRQRTAQNEPIQYNFPDYSNINF